MTDDDRHYETPEGIARSLEEKAVMADPFARALILRAAEFSILEDKGFTAKDPRAEAEGHAGLAALTWALAEYLKTDEGTAGEFILTQTT